MSGSPHQLFANDASGGLFTFRNSGASLVANDLTTANMGHRTQSARPADPFDNGEADAIVHAIGHP